MEIDELADNFVWLSIGHRLPNTNQYQLTNWHRLIRLIDQISDDRFSSIAYAGHYYTTRLALASILGPFLVYLLKFTPLTPFLHTFSSLSYSLAPTPVHWYTIWGYWNFRLEFVMPCAPQHTRDVPNLSYEYDCDLITGFFLLSCLHVRLRNVLYEVQYMSSTGIIWNFGRLRAVLWNVSHLNFTHECDSSLVPINAAVTLALEHLLEHACLWHQPSACLKLTQAVGGQTHKTTACLFDGADMHLSDWVIRVTFLHHQNGYQYARLNSLFWLPLTLFKKT